MRHRRIIRKYSKKIHRMKEAGTPAEDLILEMKDMLEEIEPRILSITGNPFAPFYRHEWTDEAAKVAEVEALMSERQYLMNQLFFLHKSPAEIERFKELNSRLKDLTDKVYKRTGEIYRRLLDAPVDPDFDDDIEVEGIIKYDCDSRTDVLRLEDDDFYGSDFDAMLSILDSLQEEIGLPDFVSVNPNTYNWPNLHSGMSDEELRLTNDLDDGTTWDEYRIPELEDTIVCHAVHDLTDHRSFSIPDFLRMNSFWCEVKTITQHIVESDGTRFRWFDRCNKEQFIAKFMKMAEHRPQHWNVGSYIHDAVRRYFDDTDDSKSPFRHPDGKFARSVGDDDAETFLGEVFDYLRKKA